MSEILANNILVGSYIKFKGNLFCHISNIFNKYLCVSRNKKAIDWLWGASFAFKKENKQKVQEILRENASLIKKLKLDPLKSAEDYFLASRLLKEGNIEITNKTFVTAYEKENTIFEIISRVIRNRKNAKIIKDYLKVHIE